MLDVWPLWRGLLRPSRHSLLQRSAFSARGDPKAPFVPIKGSRSGGRVSQLSLAPRCPQAYSLPLCGGAGGRGAGWVWGKDWGLWAQIAARRLPGNSGTAGSRKDRGVFCRGVGVGGGSLTQPGDLSLRGPLSGHPCRPYARGNNLLPGTQTHSNLGSHPMALRELDPISHLAWFPYPQAPVIFRGNLRHPTPLFSCVMV